MTVPVLLENITEWFELRTPRLNYNAALYVRVNDYVCVSPFFGGPHQPVQHSRVCKQILCYNLAAFTPMLRLVVRS